MSTETDVLVVGAGPTGLTLATQLRRYGARVEIIDANPTRSETSKALAVHARTLELFQALGVAEEAVARGRKLHGVSVMSNGSRLAHATMDELDSPFAYILCLPQPETERLLEARLSALGTAVDRGYELTAFEQDDTGVTATIAGPDGKDRTLRSQYLVGCDGAHSAVRRVLDLPFDGTDLEGRFAFADVGLLADLPGDEATAFVSSDGIVLAIPLPDDGRFRVIATPSAAEDVPAKPDLAYFQRVFDERTALSAKLVDPTWFSTFTVRQRRVTRYRTRRAFVAGDAAHAHSPVGGQGMNTGIQDAYNLGWKLGLVATGPGRRELLDSYELEREPVARTLLGNTERATRAVTLRYRVSREVRNRVAQFLSSFEVVQDRLARTIGELDLNYRKSPIVEESRPALTELRLVHSDRSETASLGDHRDFGAGPRAGDRAPDCILEPGPPERRLFELLAGPRPVALLFDGRSKTEEGHRRLAGIAERVEKRFRIPIDAFIVVRSAEPPRDLGDNHSVILDPDGHVHTRYGASAECLYLVRPDGYIGYRSQPASWEKLEGYLSRLFY